MALCASSRLALGLKRQLFHAEICHWNRVLPVDGLDGDRICKVVAGTSALGLESATRPKLLQTHSLDPEGVENCFRDSSPVFT